MFISIKTIALLLFFLSQRENIINKTNRYKDWGGIGPDPG